MVNRLNLTKKQAGALAALALTGETMTERRVAWHRVNERTPGEFHGALVALAKKGLAEAIGDGRPKLWIATRSGRAWVAIHWKPQS